MHIVHYKLHKKTRSIVIYKKSPSACFYILNYPHIYMNYNLSWEMHQYCYGQVGQSCVLHYWVFRNLYPSHSKQ